MAKEEKVERPDAETVEDAGVQIRDLEQVTSACADAPGYVIFAAKIAKNPDPKGNLVIDYHYRRYHFSYEDTREAINKFREEFMKDVSGGIHD